MTRLEVIGSNSPGNSSYLNPPAPYFSQIPNTMLKMYGCAWIHFFCWWIDLPLLSLKGILHLCKQPAFVTFWLMCEIYHNWHMIAKKWFYEYLTNFKIFYVMIFAFFFLKGGALEMRIWASVDEYELPVNLVLLTVRLSCCLDCYFLALSTHLPCH